MKPMLCYVAHRFQAHAYQGDAFLFCRRCGEILPMEVPEEPEDDEPKKKGGKR